jgi:hypothetical protein
VCRGRVRNGTWGRHAGTPARPTTHRPRRRAPAASARRCRHAPASWIQRAGIITGSWDGAGVAELARRLDCHPRRSPSGGTASTPAASTGWLTCPARCAPAQQRAPARPHHRPGPLAAARPAAPGRPGLPAPDQPEAPAHWTLDARAQAAQAEGIAVGRRQVRRILISEPVRRRRTRSWATSTIPSSPHGRRSSPAPPARGRA